MTKKILTIGEILVEIMAVEKGVGFRKAMAFRGPFASGAPAIFIDQVGRLGHPCAMVGSVGDDDFGRMTVERLRVDGVDVSAIRVLPDAVTGSAFVRYRPDGQRDFLFNIRDSAAARMPGIGEIAPLLAAAQHLHVVGSSLTVPAIAALVEQALEVIKGQGGTVSFDPNVRREIFGAHGFADLLGRIIERTDVFLPSGDELMLFAKASEPDAAIRQLLDRGVSVIVHKQGAAGARYVDRQQDVHVAGFRAEEVDPTGAGDIFGATFLVGWLNGALPRDALLWANAAGALAISKLGPMEGSSSGAEIRAFLSAHPSTEHHRAG